jgi:TPR repeat protein
MRGMIRRAVILALAVLAPAAVARAQFYDVDGAYHCLTKPDAACTKALGDAPAPPPPPATKEAKEAEAAPALAAVVARVKQGTATADDIRLLETRADAKDPRAIEVLAWCKLNGIGTPADALGAYWLYREAAGLGVAKARENQVAIFETKLTSDQRQQVLLGEGAR